MNNTTEILTLFSGFLEKYVTSNKVGRIIVYKSFKKQEFFVMEGRLKKTTIPGELKV